MKPVRWHLGNPLDCPLVKAVNVVGGKWKPIILHILMSGPHRFGQLKAAVPPVSQKVLTQQLRELEMDGLVVRQVFAEVPPRVDYSLSDRGRSLAPILQQLYEWGRQGAGQPEDSKRL